MNYEFTDVRRSPKASPMGFRWFAFSKYGQYISVQLGYWLLELWW